MKYRINFILSYAYKYLWYFIILFFGVLLTTYISSLYPSIFGNMIDSIVYLRSNHLFIKFTLLYTLIFGLSLLFQFYVDYIWAKLNRTFLYDIRKALYNKILHLYGNDLSKISSGELETRINYDCDQILSFIHGSIFHFIACILYIALSVYFVLTKNIILGVLIFSFSNITVYLSRYLSKKSSLFYNIVREGNGKSVSLLYEIFNRLQDVKVMFRYDNIRSLYMRKISDINDSRIKATNIDVIAERISSGVFLSTQLIIFIVSIILISNKSLTLGDFLAINVYYDICVSQLNFLNHKLVTVKEKTISIDRIINIFNKEAEDDNVKDFSIIKKGKIKFENVSFSYDNNFLILENFNFHTDGRELIAVVGQNGIGKSTIFNLLCKFNIINSGNILLDDIDIDEYNVKSLRDKIGYVHQDILLFNGSIRYNLTFKNETKDDTRIWDTLEKVGMDHFVKELPGTLDTQLTKFNTMLSGGQKQRLAIARAILKGCKIYIFDESVSALDSETEKSIHKLWKDLRSECTVFVITHSLTVTKLADRVVVIDNKKVIEEGTHSELWCKNGNYRLLFDIK